MPISINGSSGISGVDGSAATPALQGSDSNTGISFGTDTVSINTGGTARATVDSSGRLGIGTTSPAAPFHVYNSGDTPLRVEHSDGATTYIDIRNSSGGAYIASQTNDLSFHTSTGATERARIDSSGRLLVGATSARATFFNDTTAPRLQVEGVDEASASISIYSNENNADGPYLFLGKGRGGSVGSTTQVNSDDRLGTIQFAGLDQSAQVTAAAQIYAEVDGTPAQSGEDMPGRLIFATSADNSGSLTPTERLRIDKEVRLYNQNAYDSTTATAANLVVQSDGRFIRSTSSGKYKTDVETLEDSYADALLNCRPVWYRSLSSADNPFYGYWGFIAEEVAKIDPRLVHWKTTEPVVQEDGSLEHVPCEPEPEGVAYDRFVPHLLNLIKRQKEQIEAMEARLSVLEGGSN